jgi:CBS domain-containing protein
MFYLSQLINAAVENAQEERVGKLLDVLLLPSQQEAQFLSRPAILLIEGEQDDPWRVPVSDAEWRENTLHLRSPLSTYTQQTSATPNEVSLAHTVMDKQVIDIEHKKVLRVNDIGFDDDWHILGVDTSNLGLVRRIAPPWLLGRNRHSTLVPWEDIELLDSQRSLEEQGVTPSSPSRPSTGNLSELHPADIAAIVHQLTPEQGARLIARLDNETAADTMEEIDTDRQRHILESIDTERAADILEEMGPDEAADLLARLPDDRASDLLHRMTPEESEDVQELLEYAQDTAGGLMTTDYIVQNQTCAVADALDAIRTNIRDADVRIAYVYCVEDETQDETRILGVVTLWDLLIANPTQQLQELMETDVITVDPDMEPREVAAIMAKYNLLAVPVVSEDGVLQGVVTVDDALDVLLPNEGRRRPRRMY